jgi:hypothetical protein
VGVMMDVRHCEIFRICGGADPKRFRKLGLIDYNGSIEVHSSLLNVVLHDEPHIEI